MSEELIDSRTPLVASTLAKMRVAIGRHSVPLVLAGHVLADMDRATCSRSRAKSRALATRSASAIAHTTVSSTSRG